jgi:hypothetical protein
VGQNEKQDAWAAMLVVFNETSVDRTIFNNKNGTSSATVW